jgi:hypothetical protein
MKMLDTKKARDILEDILNKKEYTAYQNDAKGLFESLWEKAKDWLADILAKLFPSIESVNGASGKILLAIIVAVVILLTLSLLLIIRKRKRNRVLHEQKPLQSLNEINWSFQRHLEEAGKCESLEEYKLSTRHMFLALLLYFHEKDWIEARIWKTNWEYFDELRKVNQQWANQFYGLAAFFDEVTYGDRKVQKEDFNQFRTGAMVWLGENSLGERGESFLD